MDFATETAALFIAIVGAAITTIGGAIITLVVRGREKKLALDNAQKIEAIEIDSEAKQKRLIDDMAARYVLALEIASSKLQTEIDALRAELKGAFTNNAELKQELDRVRGEYGTLSHNYETIERQNRELLDAVSSIHTERDNLRQENEKMRLELSSLKERIIRLETERDVMKSLFDRIQFIAKTPDSEPAIGV